MEAPTDAALLPLTLELIEGYRCKPSIGVPAAATLADEQMTVLYANLPELAVGSRDLMDWGLCQPVWVF